ncbi:MAG: transpeptidase family protein [Treponema sp.]|uniref:penicillin-binding protein n=1 Tax=Treponema sp. TaxID=166 RepID=UPI00298DD644|nr:penicillin-binding protein [Treponema sp.]MBR5933891.1 transpeptidase family protein [Treponema sp.]
MQVNDFYSKYRLIFLGSICAVFTAIIIFAFGKLAFTPKQVIAPPVPQVERGSIVDRNGKPLAVQTNFYHFGITPKNIENVAQFASDVAPSLGLTTEEVKTTIENAKSNPKTSRFIYLKKKLDQVTYEELRQIIKEKKYNFARFDKIPGRIYPENELASQLIGYMGDDGVGLAGVEYSMQRYLSPVPKSNQGKIEQGKNVYLTIDANLQYKLEKIAREALETTQGANLMLLAASAKTGEILSYISLPSVNLNEYGTATIEQTIDRPAMTQFEPGSVFKVFSIAAAYDENVFRQDELFLCDGIFEKTMSSGEKVKITCLSHHGYLTARGALEVSCNDVTAQITDRLNTETFLAKLRGFGFGQRTGLELPGETSGSLKSTNDKYWSARSKMTISIGQEVGISAIQMLEAATYIANKGKGVQLTILSKITDKEGNIEYAHEPEYRQQVIKPETAAYILSCMQTGAEKGIGWRANLGDISIGVKTGTAQMPDTKNGGYSETDFLSDCLAFFPAEDPEIILYIVIQKAQGIQFASRIVAPVIKESADAIIDHLGMTRGGAASLAHSGKISIHQTSKIKLGESLPDFTGKSKRELLNLLDRADIHVNINGNGWVVKQNPPAGTKITKDMTIDLYLE